MAENKNVRKGKCLNIGNCNHANLKKIAEVDSLEEFVCPECKTELVEVKASQKSKAPLFIIAGVVLVAIVGGAAFFLMKGGDDTPQIVQVDPVTQPDPEPPVIIEPEEEEPTPPPATTPATTPAPTTGTLKLGYGEYTGDIKSGKANGTGTLKYTKRTLISEKDDKKRYAEEGDYVMGLFKDNQVVNVKWYGKDKVQKGSLMIGSTGL